MDNSLAASINQQLSSYEGVNVKQTFDSAWNVCYLKPWSKTGCLEVELSIGFLSDAQIKIYEKHKWVEKGKYHAHVPVIWVETYAADETGCHGYFNPQTIMEEAEDPFNFKRKVWRASLDFNWLLEANGENCIRILKEIERRAFGSEVLI